MNQDSSSSSDRPDDENESRSTETEFVPTPRGASPAAPPVTAPSRDSSMSVAARSSTRSGLTYGESPPTSDGHDPITPRRTPHPPSPQPPQPLIQGQQPPTLGSRQILPPTTRRNALKDRIAGQSNLGVPIPIRDRGTSSTGNPTQAPVPPPLQVPVASSSSREDLVRGVGSALPLDIVENRSRRRGRDEMEIELDVIGNAAAVASELEGEIRRQCKKRRYDFRPVPGRMRNQTPEGHQDEDNSNTPTNAQGDGGPMNGRNEGTDTDDSVECQRSAGEEANGVDNDDDNVAE